MRAALLAALAVTLASCAHHRIASRGETITYSFIDSGFCELRRCYSYTITLGPDGQGIFVGQRGTVKSAEQHFQATPDQVRRFAAQLRPHRPTGELLMDRAPACKEIFTDYDSVDIRWQPALRPSSHLIFYGGCDPERDRKMRADLFSAPDLLPIADLIGKH